MEIDLSRWIVHNKVTEGKRTYLEVECSICGLSSDRVRGDQLWKKVCECNKKIRGNPIPTGERFGKLVVVERSGYNGKNVFYTVKCDCGTIKELQGSQLRSGSTSSCGCTLEEKRGKKRETHGKTHTKEYKIWASVINRTTFPHKSTRKWYYDKGIKMSEEWRSSFTLFFDDMGECPEGYTLDRIDPEGDYCKENCRWASVALQSINKGLYDSNTSGVTGVHFNKKMEKWVAYLYLGKDRKHLGTFTTFEEACEARKQAEIKYRSHITE